MKKLMIMLSVIFCLSFFLNTVQAQQEKLTYDEWKQMLQQYQQRETDAKSQIPALETAIAKMKLELDPLKAELAKCQDEVSALQAKLSKLMEKPQEVMHTVVKGECLWKIAGYSQYFGNPLRWPIIYRANRDKIHDPNLIYPNWVLRISLEKMDSYKVMKGDWLSRIAGYWEVYGNWREWTKIYQANKDQIKDPNLIQPGQVFTVPR